jgi:hypothetical protein
VQRPPPPSATREQQGHGRRQHAYSVHRLVRTKRPAPCRRPRPPSTPEASGLRANSRILRGKRRGGRMATAPRRPIPVSAARVQRRARAVLNPALRLPREWPPERLRPRRVPQRARPRPRCRRRLRAATLCCLCLPAACACRHPPRHTPRKLLPSFLSPAGASLQSPGSCGLGTRALNLRKR